MASSLDSAALAGLLARCALRDQQAFAVLYETTSAKLFGVALRILRRSNWAEEVLQEAFVNIWNHAADYTPAKSAPLTWMTSVVRNRALDWLRRPRDQEIGDAYEAMVDAKADDAPGPLEALAGAAEGAMLARCLERLDARQRQSIALAYFHGLSHSELASHLQEPLGSVKTWIRRGLQHLRACLTAA